MIALLNLDSSMVISFIPVSVTFPVFTLIINQSVFTILANEYRLAEKILNKIQQAELKLTILDNGIQKAIKALTDLNFISEFTMTVSAAQNDDRKAFDKLEQWSKDNNYPFSEKAGQAWQTIFESHNEPTFNSNFTIPWNKNIDPSKLKIASIKKSLF